MNSGLAGNPLFCSVFVPTMFGMKTLDDLRQLPAEPKGSGLYFLWHGDDLMYLGSSVDVPNRLYWHACAWKFKAASYRVIVPHNRSTFLAWDRETMRAEEVKYLQKYRPPFNKLLNS